jgi:long-chain acyl-CoA synthetase
MNFTQLFEILEYQQQRFPQKVAAAGKVNGQWRTWTTEELLASRDKLCAELLGIGLRAGDCIGILAHCGSPEWLIADMAMMKAGIVPVPIHYTARLDEIAHIAQDARLRGCFVSNSAMRQRLEEAGIELGKEAAVGHQELPLFLFPDHKGESQGAPAACPEGTATILYTSGTTGKPKGVLLTHQNIVSNVKSVLAIVPTGPETTAVSFLPLSHILERMVMYTYQASGTPIWFADSMEKLPKILQEVRPHFFTAVPRVLERIYERLLEERNKSGRLKRKILDWAIALGHRFPYSGGRAMPLDYRFKRWLADLLVFRHWRKRMGGRIRYIAVGAAALQPQLGRLFSAAGIDVREGYGLTETSPVIAFNRFEPGGVHFGTVGIPAPGVDVRIGEERDEAGNGEVEVRGPNVTAGYLNLPEETAERFTADGWFKTGDLGRFEHKRFLRITGRKSEVFKTTTGKFVAPAFVEQQLARSPFVSQSMATGLNRPFVSALIVPNFDVLEEWCRENRVHWTSPRFMVLNPKVLKFYQQEIERINEAHLGAIDNIKAFHLLPDPWTSENGLLTPTLKLRREIIARQFEAEIEKMYR